jgi:hypothetical protein
VAGFPDATAIDQNGLMTDPHDGVEKAPAELAVERALEALVYAPIGLLFDGANVLPQLIEKGRSQVTMARMIGKFAVDQGRTEATKAAGKLQDQAAGVIDILGGSILAPVPAPPEARPAPSLSARPAPLRRATSGNKSVARQAARKVAGVTAGATAAGVAGTTRAAKSARTTAAAAVAVVIDAAGLAIPDYDGLSASHVVNRLAGLSAVELEAVRAYELANRGRKTILSKVAQLQSS